MPPNRKLGSGGSGGKPPTPKHGGSTGGGASNNINLYTGRPDAINNNNAGKEQVNPLRSRLSAVLSQPKMNINLDVEVDRLVGAARVYAEKEKFKLKQFYEEEIKRTKKAVIQEFKCAMEREIIGPLKTKLCSYEKEIFNLKQDLETACKHSSRAQSIVESVGPDGSILQQVETSNLERELINAELEKAHAERRSLFSVMRSENIRKSLRASIARGSLFLSKEFEDQDKDEFEYDENITTTETMEEGQASGGQSRTQSQSAKANSIGSKISGADRSRATSATSGKPGSVANAINGEPESVDASATNEELESVAASAISGKPGSIAASAISGKPGSIAASAMSGKPGSVASAINREPESVDASATNEELESVAASAMSGKPGSVAASAISGKPGSIAASAISGKPGSIAASAISGKPGSIAASAMSGKPGSVAASAISGKPGSIAASAISGKPGSVAASATNGKPGSIAASAMSGKPGSVAASAASRKPGSAAGGGSVGGAASEGEMYEETEGMFFEDEIDERTTPVLDENGKPLGETEVNLAGPQQTQLPQNHRAPRNSGDHKHLLVESVAAAAIDINPDDISEETQKLLAKIQELTKSLAQSKQFTEEEIADLIQETELVEELRKKIAELEAENEALMKRIEEQLSQMEIMRPPRGSIEDANFQLRMQLKEMEEAMNKIKADLEGERDKYKDEMDALQKQLEGVREELEVMKREDERKREEEERKREEEERKREEERKMEEERKKEQENAATEEKATVEEEVAVEEEIAVEDEVAVEEEVVVEEEVAVEEEVVVEEDAAAEEDILLQEEADEVGDLVTPTSRAGSAQSGKSGASARSRAASVKPEAPSATSRAASVKSEAPSARSRAASVKSEAASARSRAASVKSGVSGKSAPISEKSARVSTPASMKSGGGGSGRASVELEQEEDEEPPGPPPRCTLEHPERCSIVERIEAEYVLEIEELRQKLDKTQAELEAIARLEERIKELELEIIEMEALRNRIDELNAELEELRNKEPPECPRPSETEKLELQRKLGELESISQKRLEDYESLQRRAGELEAKNADLAMSVAQLEAANEKASNAEQLHAQMLEEKRRKSAECNNLALKMREVEAEKWALQRELDDKKKQLEDLMKELESLRQEDQQMKEELSKLKETAESSRQGEDALTSELQKKTELLSQLQSKIDLLSAENERLKTEVESLRKQLADASYSRSNLEAELAHLKRQVDGVERDHKREMDAIKQRCAEECGQLSKKGQCILDHEKKCLALTDQLADDNIQLQERIRQLEQQLEEFFSMEKRTKELQKDMNTLQIRAAERTKELQNLKNMPEACSLDFATSNPFGSGSLSPWPPSNKDASFSSTGGGGGKKRDSTQCRLLSTQLANLDAEKRGLNLELEGKRAEFDAMNRKLAGIEEENKRVRGMVHDMCADAAVESIIVLDDRQSKSTHGTFGPRLSPIIDQRDPHQSQRGLDINDSQSQSSRLALPPPPKLEGFSDDDEFFTGTS